MSSTKALIIEPDGTISTRQVPSTDTNSINDLIGGYAADLTDEFAGIPWALFCDRDANDRALPQNTVATALAAAYMRETWVDRPLRGRALIFGPDRTDVPKALMQHAEVVSNAYRESSKPIGG